MPLVPASISDFSRGLDLVSSLPTLESGFTPNAKNFRIAEYGGIEKCQGYSAFCDGGSGVVMQELFDFAKRDGSANYLIAVTNSAWKYIDSSGTATNLRTGLTTPTDATFVAYEDVLYGLDTKNDMASWPGTGSVTTHAPGATTGPPQGIILGVWEDRLWVAVASSGKLTTRVEFSEPGDFTQWPGNYVNLGGPGTTDSIVAGVPMPDGLVVFTTNSTYKIYDSETGFANLVDKEHGLSSRHSLAVVDGMIYGVTAEGVFRTNGSFPLQLVSRRIASLFVNERPTLSNAAGVRWFNSYLLTYQRSLAYNDLTLECTPSLEQVSNEPPFMANELRAHRWCVSSLAGGEQRLYFIDAGNKRYIRRAFDGGSFLTTASPGVATPIACYYETPPMDFGVPDKLKRLHKVRAVGRGDIRLGVKTDFTTPMRDTAALGFAAAQGGQWDVGQWDGFSWGGYDVSEGWTRIQARARRLGLRIFESSSNVAPMRDTLDTGSSRFLGGAGAYLLEPYISISSRHR